jgi:hypothetical protein
MKTQFKIARFWISANYNQLFIIRFIFYFFMQSLRLLF